MKIDRHPHHVAVGEWVIWRSISKWKKYNNKLFGKGNWSYNHRKRIVKFAKEEDRTLFLLRWGHDTAS